MKFKAAFIFSGIATILLAMSVVLLILIIGNELADGVTISLNRTPPRPTYMRSVAPWAYWITIATHAVGVVVFSGMTAVLVWIGVFEWRHRDNKS